MRNKPFLMLVLLVGLILMPGCLTLTLNTKINPDGSGQRSIDVAIDKTFASILQESSQRSGTPSLGEQMTRGLPKNATFKEWQKGNKIHYETTFSFDRIEELVKINQKMTTKNQSRAPRSAQLTLEKKDGLFFVLYQFSETFPAGQGSAGTSPGKSIQPFTATYKLVMPGHIYRSSADKTKGAQATWYIDPKKKTVVKASSFYVRWWTIIVTVLLLLFLIVLLAIVRRNRKKERALPATDLKKKGRVKEQS